MVPEFCFQIQWDNHGVGHHGTATETSSAVFLIKVVKSSKHQIGVDHAFQVLWKSVTDIFHFPQRNIFS